MRYKTHGHHTHLNTLSFVYSNMCVYSMAVLGDSKIIINSLKEDNESLAPYRVLGSQSRTGGCIDLTNETIYFGTGQY